MVSLSELWSWAAGFLKALTRVINKNENQKLCNEFLHFCPINNCLPTTTKKYKTRYWNFRWLTFFIYSTPWLFSKKHCDPQQDASLFPSTWPYYCEQLLWGNSFYSVLLLVILNTNVISLYSEIVIFHCS